MVVLQAGMCTSRPVYFASEVSCCYIDSVGDVVIVWSLWLTKMFVLFLAITITKC